MKPMLRLQNSTGAAKPCPCLVLLPSAFVQWGNHPQQDHRVGYSSARAPQEGPPQGDQEWHCKSGQRATQRITTADKDTAKRRIAATEGDPSVIAAMAMFRPIRGLTTGGA